MSGEYGYIVRLLRKLEFLLSERGRQRDAGRVGQIIQRIARADDVRAALKTLYAVEGYDRLAQRLLYYADKMGPFQAEFPEERLIEYHVGKLYEALVNEGSGEARRTQQRVPPSGDVSQCVDEFASMLHELRRNATEGEQFREVRRDDLEKLLQKAHNLAVTAQRGGSADIARFAASAGTFVRFVLDRSLVKDVRVINILDNAVLTVQTILPSVGADDYDSLTQTNQLLADPATLLE
jgi:hypothetical protein